jgi:hypothetical protein
VRDSSACNWAVIEARELNAGHGARPGLNLDDLARLAAASIDHQRQRAGRDSTQDESAGLRILIAGELNAMASSWSNS